MRRGRKTNKQNSKALEQKGNGKDYFYKNSLLKVK